jgi:hypothetical protein
MGSVLNRGAETGESEDDAPQECAAVAVGSPAVVAVAVSSAA